MANGRRRIYVTLTCENGHTEKRLFDNIARGHGCKACAKENHKSVCIKHFQKYSVESILTALNQKGYAWLNMQEYINAASILEVRCDKCGCVTHFNVSNAFSNRGCRGCGPYRKKTTADFAQIALDTDDGYELISEYKTCKDKVTLKHNVCGHTFDMTPDSFTSGSRCPHCMTSHGELEIRQHLDSKGVHYIQQYKFSNCRNIKPLPFDFYIPELNTCIEYNGQQHYLPVDYFGGNSGYMARKKNDEIKRSFCDENGISLVIIPYWEFTEIGGVIDGIISKAK